MKRKSIWWIASVSLCLLLLSGHIRGCKERINAGRVYVTGRPDLGVGCGTDCPGWAKSHASDFLDGSGVPITRVKGLRIAIMQYNLSPAPETIVFRCSLSPQQMRQFLRGKKRRFTTFEKIIQEYQSRGYPILVFPFKSLSWWPPEKSNRSRLKIYEGNNFTPGGYHYIFIDEKAYSVWVLAPASRGR